MYTYTDQRQNLYSWFLNNGAITTTPTVSLEVDLSIKLVTMMTAYHLSITGILRWALLCNWPHHVFKWLEGLSCLQMIFNVVPKGSFIGKPVANFGEDLLKGFIDCQIYLEHVLSPMHLLWEPHCNFSESWAQYMVTQSRKRKNAQWKIT